MHIGCHGPRNLDWAITLNLAIKEKKFELVKV